MAKPSGNASGKFPRAYVNTVPTDGDPKLIYVGGDGTEGFTRLGIGARKSILPKGDSAPGDGRQMDIDHVGDTTGGRK